MERKIKNSSDNGKKDALKSKNSKIEDFEKFKFNLFKSSVNRRYWYFSV
jgi:hypothetical protein